VEEKMEVGVQAGSAMGCSGSGGLKIKN